ncbi:MAG: ribonuclease PH [Planctomycetes bacterium]|nr:ribonuclease PH [Planctomycetota bacterium]MCP4770877.1 ribonuclease PH [Planctomycetota bacterium]MCP4862298.1 ribonuclease PH [Planctomycetota bacterium]
MSRNDGRSPDQLRPLSFQREFTSTAEGSVLVSAGNTRVLCTASVTNGVPSWRRESGKGWLTAEYAMLPGSVVGRKRREYQRRDGRSIEIQRLIGRSLRAAVDMRGFPNVTINLDCDVLQADGGTRCASICGAMMAIHDALKVLDTRGKLVSWPLRNWIAGVSVGHVDGRELLDLDYSEDSIADVDMNVIATDGGALVEVQGTAEGEPFARDVHDRLLDLAIGGTNEIIAAMRAAVDPVQATS